MLIFDQKVFFEQLSHFIAPAIIEDTLKSQHRVNRWTCKHGTDWLARRFEFIMEF